MAGFGHVIVMLPPTIRRMAAVCALMTEGSDTSHRPGPTWYWTWLGSRVAAPVDQALPARLNRRSLIGAWFVDAWPG